MVIRTPILFTSLKADLFQDMVNEYTMPYAYLLLNQWQENMVRNFFLKIFWSNYINLSNWHEYISFSERPDMKPKEEPVCIQYSSIGSSSWSLLLSIYRLKTFHWTFFGGHPIQERISFLQPIAQAAWQQHKTKT